MAERVEPHWVRSDVALAIHDRQLAEHGGPIGVRDAGALNSALMRPVNQWSYGTDDLFALAAAYAFGIAATIRLSMATSAPHGCWRGCS